jgi:hypothetical protein
MYQNVTLKCLTEMFDLYTIKPPFPRTANFRKPMTNIHMRSKHDGMRVRFVQQKADLEIFAN